MTEFNPNSRINAPQTSAWQPAVPTEKSQVSNIERVALSSIAQASASAPEKLSKVKFNEIVSVCSETLDSLVKSNSKKPLSKDSAVAPKGILKKPLDKGNPIVPKGILKKEGSFEKKQSASKQDRFADSAESLTKKPEPKLENELPIEQPQSNEKSSTQIAQKRDKRKEKVRDEEPDEQLGTEESDVEAYYTLPLDPEASSISENREERIDKVAKSIISESSGVSSKDSLSSEINKERSVGFKLWRKISRYVNPTTGRVLSKFVVCSGLVKIAEMDSDMIVLLSPANIQKVPKDQLKLLNKEQLQSMHVDQLEAFGPENAVEVIKHLGGAGYDFIPKMLTAFTGNERSTFSQKLSDFYNESKERKVSMYSGVKHAHGFDVARKFHFEMLKNASAGSLEGVSVGPLSKAEVSSLPKFKLDSGEEIEISNRFDTEMHRVTYIINGEKIPIEENGNARPIDEIKKDVVSKLFDAMDKDVALTEDVQAYLSVDVLKPIIEKTIELYTGNLESGLWVKEDRTHIEVTTNRGPEIQIGFSNKITILDYKQTLKESHDYVGSASREMEFSIGKEEVRGKKTEAKVTYKFFALSYDKSEDMSIAAVPPVVQKATSDDWKLTKLDIKKLLDDFSSSESGPLERPATNNSAELKILDDFDSFINGEPNADLDPAELEGLLTELDSINESSEELPNVTHEDVAEPESNASLLEPNQLSRSDKFWRFLANNAFRYTSSVFGPKKMAQILNHFDEKRVGTFLNQFLSETNIKKEDQGKLLGHLSDGIIEQLDRSTLSAIGPEQTVHMPPERVTKIINSFDIEQLGTFLSAIQNNYRSQNHSTEGKKAQGILISKFSGRKDIAFKLVSKEKEEKIDDFSKKGKKVYPDPNPNPMDRTVKELLTKNFNNQSSINRHFIINDDEMAVDPHKQDASLKEILNGLLGDEGGAKATRLISSMIEKEAQDIKTKYGFAKSIPNEQKFFPILETKISDCYVTVNTKDKNLQIKASLPFELVDIESGKIVGSIKREIEVSALKEDFSNEVIKSAVASSVDSYLILESEGESSLEKVKKLDISQNFHNYRTDMAKLQRAREEQLKEEFNPQTLIAWADESLKKIIAEEQREAIIGSAQIRKYIVDLLEKPNPTPLEEINPIDEHPKKALAEIKERLKLNPQAKALDIAKEIIEDTKKRLPPENFYGVEVPSKDQLLKHQEENDRIFVQELITEQLLKDPPLDAKEIRQAVLQGLDKEIVQSKRKAEDVRKQHLEGKATSLVNFKEDLKNLINFNLRKKEFDKLDLKNLENLENLESRYKDEKLFVKVLDDYVLNRNRYHREYNLETFLQKVYEFEVSALFEGKINHPDSARVYAEKMLDQVLESPYFKKTHLE